VGFFLCSLEDLLNKKRELRLNYHLNHIEKIRFCANPFKQTNLLRYQRGIFDFFKNNLLKASCTYFRSKKKGSFGSISVRIRVNIGCS
jgi:hypothetical protein